MFASGIKGGGGGGGGFESYAKTGMPATTVNPSTWTKLPFTSVDYDNLNEVDTVTNKRWTAEATGIYKITAVATLEGQSSAAGFGTITRLYKNGASQSERGPAGHALASSDNHAPAMQTTTLSLTAGDYIEVYFWHNNASAKLSVLTDYCTFERIA